mgnify:CR=1 FL=1
MTDSTLEHLRQWATDPIAFNDACIGDPLLDWQARAFLLLASRRKLAIRSGHGVGKSNFDARVIYWFLCTRIPTKILITAPTKHQISDILFPELHKIKRTMLPELASQIEDTEGKLFLKGASNECFAVARTSRKEVPEAFQGVHEENVLILADEASGIADDVFITGEGSLSTPDSYCLLTSNPTRRSGFFADIFLKQEMRDTWATMKVSCFDSPVVDPNYITYIEKKYGKGSNTYRIRILGEFPTSDEDVLIPRYLVEEAAERTEIIQAPYREIWGVDVARSGPNKSVLLRRAGRQLTRLQQFKDMDSIQLSGRVNQEYKDCTVKPKAICVDVIGPGSGVYDRLLYKGLPVVAILGNAASSFPEQHCNLRMDNFAAMAEWFRQPVKILPDEDLIEQCSNLFTKFTLHEKIRMLTKQEFKDKGIESPDCADALALTFAEEDELEDENIPGMELTAKHRRYSVYQKRSRSYMAR